MLSFLGKGHGDLFVTRSGCVNCFRVSFIVIIIVY